MQQYLEAGKVVTTHGVRGEMKLELWCDGVDFLKKVGRLYPSARLLRYAPAREHTPHDPYFVIIVHFPVRNKNLKAKSPAKSKKLSKQGF